MVVNFFDDKHRTDLFPLTQTRPAADLRMGILTLAEKWAHYLDIENHGFYTVNHLKTLFPAQNTAIFINGRLLPNKDLAHAIEKLSNGDYLAIGDTVLAYHTNQANKVSYTEEWHALSNCTDLFVRANQEIAKDFEALTKHKISAKLHSSVTVIGDYGIFLAPGAKAHACVFNTTAGPIYLAEDSEVMEGSLIRGPFALGKNSTIKMGAKIYGGTSIGPHCKVGGEVSNAVFLGYSNKGHDGFLGNSVLGEWCNLGADTNTSNLKNNYEEVKLWNYTQEKFAKTGLQFCGLVMGDHSKTSINTMLNTGTVIGVSCNIFGSGFPRNFIPSFAWGGAAGFSTYQINKAVETAKLVYERRNKSFGLDEEYLLTQIFAEDKKYRNWEI